MESDRESQALVPAESRPLTSVAGHAGIVVPRVIAAAGEKAARRFLEFFAATIRNKNTRQAYYHAVVRFFTWCDKHKIGEIADIEPLHVAAYIEALGKDFEKPTVKQHLAAIRMLFDWLVTGQVVATNPAHAVRGPKHVVKTGKTTVLTGEQARELLDSIDTSTLVGLRDRALISVMTFAFARIGAVVAMRVEDYYPKGKRWWVRLHEKGGKRHEMPAHHTLEAYLDSYGCRPDRGGKASGRGHRLPSRESFLRQRSAIGSGLDSVQRYDARLGARPSDLRFCSSAHQFRLRARAGDEDSLGSLPGRSRGLSRLCASGGGVLPRLKHPGALLHWISGRRRHPATLFAGRFRGMVRGLSRRAMVYVRCAQQRPSDWQGVTGPGTRCRRCSDHNNVRPQYPLELSGLDGRNSGRAGMTVLLVFEQEARACI
jgi:site-specific recombinase XerD